MQRRIAHRVPPQFIADIVVGLKADGIYHIEPAAEGKPHHFRFYGGGLPAGFELAHGTIAIEQLADEWSTATIDIQPAPALSWLAVGGIVLPLCACICSGIVLTPAVICICGPWLLMTVSSVAVAITHPFWLLPIEINARIKKAQRAAAFTW